MVHVLSLNIKLSIYLFFVVIAPIYLRYNTLSFLLVLYFTGKWIYFLYKKDYLKLSTLGMHASSIFLNHFYLNGNDC